MMDAMVEEKKHATMVEGKDNKAKRKKGENVKEEESKMNHVIEDKAYR